MSSPSQTEHATAPVERFEPERLRGELVEAEHLVRYHWAAAAVANREVLDAGCGVGYGSALLVQLGGARRCVGIDIAPDAIEQARARHGGEERLDFQLGDVTALGFPDNSFDVVTCFETVEHIDQTAQERFVAEAARVLRPGGLLIASSPNRAQYPPGNPYHVRELTPDELEQLARGGFAEVRLVRQHNWVASAILDDPSFEAAGVAEVPAVEARKLQGRRPGEELYTLAVASDAPFDLPAPRALLTHGLEVRRWMDEIERHKHEHVRTREALAQAEQELLELRDRRSIEMARLERQAYWLERGRIDLDALMQRPVMRFVFRAMARLLRVRRRLTGGG
ncbi:MAG: class I SAM-dependent methyltransferase [Solirubrobacterales bacterium]